MEDEITIKLTPAEIIIIRDALQAYISDSGTYSPKQVDAKDYCIGIAEELLETLPETFD